MSVQPSLDFGPPKLTVKATTPGWSVKFDGYTYQPDRDENRLTNQLLLVYAALSDGSEWTLADLALQARGSTASVSARIRDLRKPKFGKHEIQRRYLRDGVWVYRHALESCCNA